MLRRRPKLAKEYAEILAILYRRAELISVQDKEISRLRQELRDLRNQVTPTNPGEIK